MKYKKTSAVMCDYLATVNNEITFDSFYFEVVKSSPDAMGYLPRVPKWIPYSMRHRRLMRLATQVLRVLWVVGGAMAFFAYQAIGLLLHRRKLGRCALAPLHTEHGFVIAFSSRTADIRLPDGRGAKASWITFPWAPVAQLPAGARHANFSQLLGLGDIAMAYLRALRSVYLLAGRPRQKKWVLQSYTAFHWFAVRCAVDKLAGPMLMTEHFDRWAILLDSACSRRPAGEGQGLTLVQHGSVESVSANAEPTESTLRLPRKLRAVDQLCVYDANAEKIFRRDILSARCSRRLSAVNYFKPSITLTRLDDYQGLRVLFVGYSLCEPAHEALYRRLVAEFDLKIYYKPHPRTVMSAELEGVGWTVLREATIFPEVDLLISYPSTLVTEYRNAGVASAVHPLDIGGEDLETFYHSVVDMLKRCKPRFAGT